MVSQEEFQPFKQTVTETLAYLQQASVQARTGYDTVWAKIQEIERRINNIQAQPNYEKKGIEKMFDGKNPKLVPPVFEKEKEGSKSFKKWAASVSTYIEGADEEASKVLKDALAVDAITHGRKIEWQNKSKYIYGLLMNLTEGEAHDIVESCHKDGASGWKKLHTRWHKAQKMSSTAIAEKIRSVGKSRNLDEVNTKLTELETLYNEYFEVRGSEYGEIERKADILRIVPLELQLRLQLEIADMDNEPIQQILNKVQNYIRNMSKGTAKMDIGAVEEEAPAKKVQFESKPQVEEPDSSQYDAQYDEELNYMGPKGKGKGKGRSIKGDCWLCGKPGHMAANCKGKGKEASGGWISSDQVHFYVAITIRNLFRTIHCQLVPASIRVGPG